MLSGKAESPPFPWGVLIFTASYLTAAAIGVVVTRNGEFLFYVIVMLILVSAVVAVHRRAGLSRLVLWGLSLWGLLHMAGGLLPVPQSWPINGTVRVLYSWWIVPGLLKYDHLVHAFGFGTTTLLCWEGLRSMMPGPMTGEPAEPQRQGRGALQPTLGRLTLCAAAGMGFGALNEVVEFVAVLLVPSTNVGGYENTGWDLVSNLAGCLLAAILIRVTQRT